MNIPPARGDNRRAVNARRSAVMLFVAAAALVASHSLAAAAGETCGGTANLRCPQGLWCQKPEGTCGKAGVSGSCIKLEIFCDAMSLPVCGCDGKDYGNACESYGKTQINFSGYCDQKPK